MECALESIIEYRGKTPREALIKLARADREDFFVTKRREIAGILYVFQD